MLHKYKWGFSFVSISIFVFSVIFSINFFIDPRGDRNIIVEKYYKPVINERSKKYAYIFHQENYKNYDCVILGSSRVMKIVPSHNEKTSSCYNFGLHSSNNSEKLFLLQEWIKKGTLKKVYLGLEFYNFHKLKKPLSVNKNKFTYGNSGNYLSISTLKLSVKSFKNMLNKTPQAYFENDGSINYYNKDLLIKNNQYNFSKEKLTQDSYGTIQSNFIDSPFEIEHEVFSVLKNIKKICQTKNIALKVFITPNYSAIMDFVNLRQGLRAKFNYIRKELQVIFKDLNDFSTINSYNRNTKKFYDPWHYRVEYGDKIIEILSHKGN